MADNRCGLELELQPRAVCRSAAALPSAMEVSTWEWAGVQEVDTSPFFSWSGSRYYALVSYRCDRTVRRQFDAMSETRLQQEQASGEDASESILRHYKISGMWPCGPNWGLLTGTTGPFSRGPLGLPDNITTFPGPTFSTICSPTDYNAASPGRTFPPGTALMSSPPPSLGASGTVGGTCGATPSGAGRPGFLHPHHISLTLVFAP